MAEHDDAPLTAVAANLIDDSTRSLFRQLLAGALQELIEEQLSARIGAGLHERTATRTNQRNGHRPRTLSTPAGDVELATPRPAPDRSSRRCWNRVGEWIGHLWVVTMTSLRGVGRDVRYLARRLLPATRGA
jgi:hypothetical protein